LLEKLAGRLRWERTANGIRVEIPARLSWLALFLAGWLTFWLYGGVQAMKSLINGDKDSGFLMIWLVMWAIGACFVSATLIWSIGGKTTLTLDPLELNLQRTIFGLPWDTRVFRTSLVENLRYVPREYSSGFRGRGYNQSRIRFESEDKTRNFASGISDSEAIALINRMLDVYKFPRNRALDYIAGT
jgi:hypothetical protein